MTSSSHVARGQHPGRLSDASVRGTTRARGRIAGPTPIRRSTSRSLRPDGRGPTRAVSRSLPAMKPPKVWTSPTGSTSFTIRRSRREDCEDSSEPGIGRSVMTSSRGSRPHPASSVSEPDSGHGRWVRGHAARYRDRSRSGRRTCFFSDGVPAVPLIFNGAEVRRVPLDDRSRAVVAVVHPRFRGWGHHRRPRGGSAAIFRTTSSSRPAARSWIRSCSLLDALPAATVWAR